VIISGQQAEAEGAFGFFAKPFDSRLIIECIERALAARVS
jgi:FixJ family two-component response regulator